MAELERAAAPEGGHAGRERPWRRYRAYIPVLAATAALFVLGELLAPGFTGNLDNILMLASFLAFACIGQSMVVFVGGFGLDLSIGSMITLGALLTGQYCAGENAMLPPVMLMTVAVACVVGLVNGVGVQKLNIPPLAMTLVMSSVVRGLAMLVTGGIPALNVPPVLFTMGRPLLGPLRTMTVVTLACLAAGEAVLRKTRFGKTVFLTGNNRGAAKLSGIKVDRTVISCYMLSAVFGALAGVMLLGYSGSASLDMGESYTMLTLAAVVVGGAKMAGGKGTLTGGLLGAFMLQTLLSILVVMGVQPSVRTFLQGVILLIIVVADCRMPRLRQ